jgi:hypothetical protein
MKGDVYPKRHEITDKTMNFEDSLKVWEKTTNLDAIKSRHMSMKLTNSKVI